VFRRIDEEGEYGYSVFYQREQDKQLNSNDLCDRIEECGEAYDEKSAYRARHINDTSAV
jgi:hypothetical protein